MLSKRFILLVLRLSPLSVINHLCEPERSVDILPNSRCSYYLYY